MTTLTLTGNQNWVRVDINGSVSQAIDIIDATAATFPTSNTGSPNQPYPFRVRDRTLQTQILGGTVDGQFDPSMDWGNLYGNGNSAAVFLQNCPAGSSIKGVTANGVVFDCFRVVNVDNYLVEDCIIDAASGEEANPYGTRDDALEADQGFNGIVRNCLFVNAFTGVSSGDANTPASSNTNRVIYDRLFMKMGLWFDDIPNTHASPFKCAANGPRLTVRDSVIAIARVDHSNFPRLQLAFDRMTVEGTSYYLNLTDNPLPSNYPSIPTGFTYLSGATARAKWDEVYDLYYDPVTPPPSGTATGVDQVCGISNTGAIGSETQYGAWSATLTIGVENDIGSGPVSDTSTVTLTVE
jgi:hypothetical protein